MGLKLNLGCGTNILEGWVNVDKFATGGVNLGIDLDEGTDTRFPYEDNSVSEFLMSHVLEHITHTLDLMQELYRIAEPDAEMLIRVPYGASNDAHEDPTHVRQYFTGSFAYFSQPIYWRADYGYRGDWQPEHISLALNEARYGRVSKQQAMGEIMGYRNVVLEMVCRMRAVKPMRERRRELMVKPEISIVLVDDEMRYVRDLE